jgi:hypothetical protein
MEIMRCVSKNGFNTDPYLHEDIQKIIIEKLDKITRYIWRIQYGAGMRLYTRKQEMIFYGTENEIKKNIVIRCFLFYDVAPDESCDIFAEKLYTTGRTYWDGHDSYKPIYKVNRPYSEVITPEEIKYWNDENKKRPDKMQYEYFHMKSESQVVRQDATKEEIDGYIDIKYKMSVITSNLIINPKKCKPLTTKTRWG